ncbi:MAG: DNA polymerase IV [Gammaproteobacteria bacterium]|nr:DNA polymerase IV [Gammaproteobacteria bacterium]
MRKIIHVDMDCFYAAIEVRDNPSLKGRPVAVGGTASRRGVLCTCNYEARRYGLRSAMPTAQALKQCPDLVLLPVNMEKYQRVSANIRSIFEKFTHQIEPLSLDEAYLDVSNNPYANGSATLIAQTIREEILKSQDITASAGVAPNKFLAKIASDWRKPDGQFVITPKDVDEFVLHLPVEKVHGIGKVTATRLREMQIKTCGDLQKLSQLELIKRFGGFGETLFNLCRGIDDREVEASRYRKSLSVEETFADDLPDMEACLNELPAIYNDFVLRLKQCKDKTMRDIKTIFIKIKFNDFSVTTAQAPVRQLRLETFAHLFQQRFLQSPKPVRLLGLGVRFKEFSEFEERQQELAF